MQTCSSAALYTLCFEIALLRLTALYVEVKRRRVSKMCFASRYTTAEADAAPWRFALKMSVFELPPPLWQSLGDTGNVAPLMPFKQDCPPGYEPNCSDERGREKSLEGLQCCGVNIPVYMGYFKLLKCMKLSPAVFLTPPAGHRMWPAC